MLITLIRRRMHKTCICLGGLMFSACKYKVYKYNVCTVSLIIHLFSHFNTMSLTCSDNFTHLYVFARKFGDIPKITVKINAFFKLEV